MAKEKLLVVDDEETLCEALRFNLEAEGYDVDVAYSAEEALTMPLEQYSLMLVDIMMGEMSGTGFASIIRKKPSTSGIPIIFCTAKDSDDDMVAGLDLGADDYITKPYSIRNVVARVKTVLRRTGNLPASPAETLQFQGLMLDLRKKSCSVDGVEIKLPRKEFEMLALLICNKGEILSRETLLKRVWPDDVIVLERVIDVNIARLRHKIEPYGKYIVTRSGYGYGIFDNP